MVGGSNSNRDGISTHLFPKDKIIRENGNDSCVFPDMWGTFCGTRRLWLISCHNEQSQKAQKIVVSNQYMPSGLDSQRREPACICYSVLAVCTCRNQGSNSGSWYSQRGCWLMQRRVCWVGWAGRGWVRGRYQAADDQLAQQRGCRERNHYQRHDSGPIWRVFGPEYFCSMVTFSLIMK